MFDKPCANWIGLDIVDLLAQLLVGEDVPVVSAATLPESALAAIVDQAMEDRRIQRLPARKHCLGERPLELGQELGHRRSCQIRSDQKMNMVRHHDPSVDRGVVLFGHAHESLDEDILDGVVLEQRESLEARKRQEPRVVRVLDAPEMSPWESRHRVMLRSGHTTCKSSAWRLPSGCATAPALPSGCATAPITPTSSRGFRARPWGRPGPCSPS